MDTNKVIRRIATGYYNMSTGLGQREKIILADDNTRII